MTGRNRRPRTPRFQPLPYGGWPDYQTWADNDFQPRPAGPAPRPHPDAEATVVIPLPVSRRRPDAFVEWADDDAVVRPYLRTHGRVSSAYDLRLETMVSASGKRPVTASMSPDVAAVRSLCAQKPQSVAELSAYLKAPLGVTRVIIGDAIEGGLVSVRRGACPADNRPSADVLRQVRDGLRAMG
ncbi:DUF742 domain-containing protein [Allokutzneria oryzae]|uniref:DUF742 domain-containing protein n=1 Tax=Allokutzneria oryzae TaxID=1378989 RepID=A0ABV5ZXL7_9PSEU